MADWREMTFSQLALGIYDTCHLKFRYRYIDKLYWSAMWGMPAEQREGIEQGQLFHLLARRYYSGLPVGDLTGHPRALELTTWLDALQRFRPYDQEHQFYPECELRLNRPGLQLVAKFDLLVVHPDGSATIYDWKTESPARATYYKNSWQTIVYRYMLAEAGGMFSPAGRFKPEQVRMVYFSPKAPSSPVLITYTGAQRKKDGVALESRVREVLATQREYFAATTELGKCTRCEYQPLCHGRRTDLLQVDEEEYLTEATLSWEDLIGGDLP